MPSIWFFRHLRGIFHWVMWLWPRPPKPVPRCDCHAQPGPSRLLEGRGGSAPEIKRAGRRALSPSSRRPAVKLPALTTSMICRHVVLMHPLPACKKSHGESGMAEVKIDYTSGSFSTVGGATSASLVSVGYTDGYPKVVGIAIRFTDDVKEDVQFTNPNLVEPTKKD